MSRKLDLDQITIALRGMLFLTMSVVLGMPQGALAEANDSAGWHASLGGGMLFYEQDEEFEFGQLYEVKLGRGLSDKWTVEGSLGYLPYLNNNRHDPSANTPANDRFQLDDETWGVRGALDLLYHLGGESAHWDPFVAATGGVTYYDANLENSQHFDPFGGLGGGLAYNLEKGWLVRGDYRAVVAGQDTEINHQALVSLGYRWGGRAVGMGEAGRGDEFEKEARRLKPVYFAFDSAELSETARGSLRENAKWLEDNSSEEVILEGHCDERGTNEYNMALGERRATSARNYLSSLGVKEERMDMISYGEERPADPRSNEEAWAKNRRVETTVKE